MSADTPTPDSAEQSTSNAPEQVRLIIAGSRTFMDGQLFSDIDRAEAVDEFLADTPLSPADVDVVISGTATGADYAGEIWATSHGIRLERYPAPWEDTDDKPAEEIGTRQDGSTYWKRAGHHRNEQMADTGTHLLAIWDGSSPGTRSMIDFGRERLGEDRVFVKTYR